MPAFTPPHWPGQPAARASLDVVEQIEEIFGRLGAELHESQWPGPVTATQHALQCAQLAEWAQAPDSLVAAALLHDIGHLVGPRESNPGADDAHELRALGLLGSAFGRDLLEPIRLHVQAKRYLASLDEHYLRRLRPLSVDSLARQGGPMSRDEAQHFEEQPWAGEAVALRRWDDAALEFGKPTPPLRYYLDLLERLRLPAQPSRTFLGPTDIS